MDHRRLALLKALLLCGNKLFANDTSGSSMTQDGSSTITFIEPLAKPQSAPKDLILPAIIDDGAQWRGSVCGVVHPVNYVFHEAAQWQEFWTKAMKPYVPSFKKVPDIDFTKEMVVAVFRGEQTLPIFETKIISVKMVVEDGKQTMVVRYKNIDHFQGISTPAYAVQPFHLKKVSVFSGPVCFEQTH
jgi:hypothetical protein